MKAITLHQPWASLVALGVKTVETRSWSAKYRGPIAIHAGARQVHSGKFLLLARIARSAGLITADDEQVFRALDVPFGAVVATANLVDVVPTEALGWAGSGHGWRHVWVLDEDEHDTPVVSADQRPYGDFGPGRFAWLLDDVVAVDPAPARGRQQMWEWAGA